MIKVDKIQNLLSNLYRQRYQYQNYIEQYLKILILRICKCMCVLYKFSFVVIKKIIEIIKKNNKNCIYVYNNYKYIHITY